jgi:hypothetical protein
VTIHQQPDGQVCSVENGVGSMPASNVTNVEIDCVFSKELFVFIFVHLEYIRIHYIFLMFRPFREKQLPA